MARYTEQTNFSGREAEILAAMAPIADTLAEFAGHPGVTVCTQSGSARFQQLGPVQLITAGQFCPSPAQPKTATDDLAPSSAPGIITVSRYRKRNLRLHDLEPLDMPLDWLGALAVCVREHMAHYRSTLDTSALIVKNGAWEQYGEA